jgi:hypothetical protein
MGGNFEPWWAVGTLVQYCKDCMKTTAIAPTRGCRCGNRSGVVTGQEILDNPALRCEFYEKRGYVPR